MACPKMAVLAGLLAVGVPVSVVVGVAAVGVEGRRLVVVGVVASRAPGVAEGDLLAVVVLQGGVIALGAS